MRHLIFTFLFLFTLTSVYAQKTVSYVSFFPPAHVVHNEVSLTQNNDSFIYDHSFFASNPDYTALQGGLILGATENSTTTIKNIAVTVPSGQELYAIKDFKVDNVIKVSSAGLIENINIGLPCNQTTSSCDKVFISADVISLPYFSNYPNNKIVNIAVSDTAFIKAKFSKSGYANNFLPDLLKVNGQQHNKVQWVNLRIKGTEECRPYLVSYRGSTVPQNNCDEPSGD